MGIDAGKLVVDFVNEPDVLLDCRDTVLAGTVSDKDVSDILLDTCVMVGCIVLLAGGRVELIKSEDACVVDSNERGTDVVVAELISIVCKGLDVVILEEATLLPVDKV